MEKKESNLIPMLMMVVCAVLWSMGGILIKLISWHPLCIVSFRGIIAALTLFLFMKYKRYKFEFNKHALAIALGMSICMILFVVANKMTTAANAIVIQYLCPVWVLLIGVIFLKQKAKKSDVIVVIICIAGIVLFFLDKLSPGNMVGNCLAIGSGMALAAMFVAQTQSGSQDVKYTGMVIGQLITVVVGSVGFFLEPFNPTGAEIGYILALGILQIGLPYIIFAYVSGRISPLAISLIGMVEPVLNPVWVATFYGEVPGFFALVGGAVVIITTSVWCVIQNRN